MVSASITIATVPVDNPGNLADSTGYGSVGYNYSIGEYDVTSSQYTAFLNAVAATDTYGVYNSAMAGTTQGNPGIIQSGSSGSFTYSVTAGRGNYPVTDVTFWDATRFANWLSNNQPNGAEGPGTTETGTYTLTSAGIAADNITRNSTGNWAVASENEWYKAAYYSPAINGYWLYPTQSNTISTAQANYNLTDSTQVGSYPDPSYYGTYDQGGDVGEWEDTIISTPPPSSDLQRVLRGGAFDSGSGPLESTVRGYDLSTGLPGDTGSPDVGFRVSEVPEPVSFAVLTLGGMTLLARRVRVRV